jgi:hypothetical protein
MTESRLEEIKSDLSKFWHKLSDSEKMKWLEHQVLEHPTTTIGFPLTSIIYAPNFLALPSALQIGAIAGFLAGGAIIRGAEEVFHEEVKSKSKLKEVI